MMVLKEEYAKWKGLTVKKIDDRGADEADEGICLAKLLEWQQGMALVNFNTYQVIPFLNRLEKLWQESGKSESMTFIKYLHENKIYMIDEKMIKDWKSVYDYLIADYPMFKYVKISLSELAKHAKKINAYLNKEGNEKDSMFWEEDTYDVEDLTESVRTLQSK